MMLLHRWLQYINTANEYISKIETFSSIILSSEPTPHTYGSFPPLALHTVWVHIQIPALAFGKTEVEFFFFLQLARSLGQRTSV